MNLQDAKRQKSRQLELAWEDRGEAPKSRRSVEALRAEKAIGRLSTDRLMEWVVAGENLHAARRRVRQNKGRPGIDGMKVEELPQYLMEQWGRIREELLAGTYQPEKVKRVEIKKRNGGVRQLGIPTVVDRVIQQMILNVIQPIIDPTFSEHSYGYRPGRSGQQAIAKARGYIQEGRRWVVDVDLENFFDRVNHDILMNRLARRIKDKRILTVIRRYLEAGVMAHGVVVERDEGTPQGGPLSPLLANVLLDEVDQELEKRGHAFVRYADDGNVYVRSKRAAEDVLATLKRLYGRLKLKVNENKSRVRRVWESQYLGYSFWAARGKEVKLRVGNKAMEEMKQQVRAITSRNRGRKIEEIAQEMKAYLIGWKQYFRLTETSGIFERLDGWIGRRLRMLRLKQWKRGKTIYRELVAAGVSHRAAASVAACSGSWWKMAGTSALNIAMPKVYFAKLGVPRLSVL